MLIMSRFYDYHIIKNHEPAAALRLAQRWLIDASNQNIIDYLETKISEGVLTNSETMPIISQLKLHEPDAYTYSQPYYWAAFVFYGA